MPRRARLDAPGTLHHVIVRGIERGRIVADHRDRVAFLTRLGAAATATGTVIYAWALLPNHAHLLLRSGPSGLPPFMRRFLTGYAGDFNRRHKRHGHLFQNRYKSIVVEEDAYFRELVRYIHLNPLRAKSVQNLSALDRFPWCGHAALLGRVVPPWHDRRSVLAWFGRTEKAARRSYRAYVQEGLPQGRRPELVGGGLVRSLGGWAEVRAIRQRKAPVLADPRILGTGAFVEQMLQAGDARLGAQRGWDRRREDAQKWIIRHCRRAGITPEEVRRGGRRQPVATVRAQIAVGLVTELGLSLAEAARQLGISTSGIAKILSRKGKHKST